MSPGGSTLRGEPPAKRRDRHPGWTSYFFVVKAISVGG